MLTETAGTAPEADYPPLTDVLTLTPLGEDRYVADSPRATADRLFGGQVAAQALRAACATTAPDRMPYSLHAQFLRAGRLQEPVTFDVTRTSNGRSFAGRHVAAVQAGRTILTLTASFHVGEPGEDWHACAAVGRHPETLPARPTALDRSRAASRFELRPVRGPVDGEPPLHPLWLRARDPLPEDPALHACVLTFVTDFGLAMSARRRHRGPHPVSATASLDHSVWFHRPVRADDWILLSTEATSVAGGRCHVQGALHTPEGRLAATIAQVVMVRTAPSGRS